MESYKSVLKKYNQDDLLKTIENCSEKNKAKIISQIKKIDFDKIDKLYEISNINYDKLDTSIIEHLNYYDKYNLEAEFEAEVETLGNKIIEKNQYAVVTMAGGQGTRLEHNGPKGTYLLNIKPKPKYLFGIIADSLKEENEKYGIVLNWYIMTSEENNKETINFFQDNNYFGYPKQNIKFFVQGYMPLLNEEGKLILDENYNIKTAADGNGCVFKSLKESGMIDDMKSKKIKWVFIGAVDNAILNMVDPVLLGLTVYQKNEVASKSIVKANPYEKVGIFCKKEGKPSVIEYSEMPLELAEMKDEDGELLYGESHIMCNLFSIKALEKIARQNLPYHSAHKKAKYLDVNGNIVEPSVPNVYKYEAFIFDGFRYFDDITILRGRREEDFAPIKNKHGVDSPETAVKLYNNRYFGRI